MQGQRREQNARADARGRGNEARLAKSTRGWQGRGDRGGDEARVEGLPQGVVPVVSPGHWDR